MIATYLFAIALVPISIALFLVANPDPHTAGETRDPTNTPAQATGDW